MTRHQRTSDRTSTLTAAATRGAAAGLFGSDCDTPTGWNLAMHWGTGAVLGALRGVWAAVGIRGARANVTHTVVRLAFDQTVENATGVGAPPATWPRLERRVDVVHKAAYSFVTGWVADRWIAARMQSQRGVSSH